MSGTAADMSQDPDRSKLLTVQSQWRAPPELLAVPLPRPARLTGAGKFVLVVGVLMFALGVFLGAWAITDTLRGEERQQRLEREGVNTRAEIVKNWLERRRRWQTRRYVIYRFEANGRSYERLAMLSSRAFQNIRVGDLVPVRYVASSPEQSRLPEESDLWLPLWGALLVPVFFFSLLGLMAWVVLVQRRLLRWGQLTGALVTDLSQMYGNQHVFYQFLDPTGSPVSGKTTSSESNVSGEIVTVLFDPNKARRSALYPPALVRLAKPG